MEEEMAGQEPQLDEEGNPIPVEVKLPPLSEHMLAVLQTLKEGGCVGKEDLKFVLMEAINR